MQLETRFGDSKEKERKAEEGAERARGRIGILEQQLQLERNRFREQGEKHEDELKRTRESLERDYHIRIRELESKFDTLLLEKDEVAQRVHEDFHKEKMGWESESAAKHKEWVQTLDHQRRETRRLDDQIRTQAKQFEQRLELVRGEMDSEKQHCDRLRFEKETLEKQVEMLKIDADQLKKDLHKELSLKLDEERFNYETRVGDLRKHHGVETGLLKEEIESLKQRGHEQAEELMERQSIHTRQITGIKSEAERAKRSWEDEASELRQAICKMEIEVKNSEEDGSRVRHDLEAKCRALMDSLEMSNKQLLAQQKDYEMRSQEERFALRKLYEAKIEKLQTRILELRREGDDVRKMIAGAAADLYSDYSASARDNAPVNGIGATMQSHHYAPRLRDGAHRASPTDGLGGSLAGGGPIGSSENTMRHSLESLSVHSSRGGVSEAPLINYVVGHNPGHGHQSSVPAHPAAGAGAHAGGVPHYAAA